jgi:TniQ
VLPFARRPFRNELVSSWLSRVACAYGTSWPQLSREIDAHGLLPIGDYGGTDEQFEFLAALTGTDVAIVRGLDLASRFPEQPVRRFLCHPRTKLAAPDYCADCFKDDYIAGRDNYLRQEWAIAGVSYCHLHKTRLRSACYGCAGELRMDESPDLRYI